MRRGRAILTLLLILLGAYAAVVGLAYAGQGRLLFPAYMVAPARMLPPDARRLTLTTPDGVKLEGVHIPPTGGRRGAGAVLVFAGNASDAQGAAELIRGYFPSHDVVAFYYRGYAPSGGAAAALQLTQDAPLVYDLVAERLRPERMVAVGISLGSGVAASLAAERPLDGLILVTPFDSLAATARQLYPWLPVRWLLRHDMRAAESLAGTRVPVAIVAAERDRTIPPERTDALRRSVPNLVHDVTLAGADHNNLFAHPDLPAAMREAMAAIESRH